MKIEKKNRLTESEKKQVWKLEKDAFAVEGLVNHAYLSNEINAVKEAPCFYLGYERGRLVSFLTTFIPTCKESEVLATTAIEERGKGYFTALWKEAKEELQRIGIEQVLFVVEKNSRSGKAKLQAYPKAEWERSEYHMEYRGRRTMEQEKKDSLRFELVTRENIDRFAEVTGDIFEEINRHSNFYDSLLEEKDREGYFVFDREKVVGVCNISYEGGRAYFYGVGVVGKERGKGYGRRMLLSALSLINAEAESIVLDVDSHNPAAYGLYRKVGFEPLNQVEYYKYIVD